MEAPIYKHDCNRCIFLGKSPDHEMPWICDIYVCLDMSHGYHTLLARYGNDAPEYRSFSVDKNVVTMFKRRPDHVLNKAYEMAANKGITFKD